MKKLRCASFFAGVGGIDLGFEQTGAFKTVYANEFDSYPAKTFELNFDLKVDVRDIRDVQTKEIPYSDVYDVYFLNTISSDFNELKPFLGKIKDESDFEDYYNTEYQWLKVNNYKTKQYSFEDDIIEEGLRKANERFYLLKDKQYTGRFKVFLPTKKLFAFAVNY